MWLCHDCYLWGVSHAAVWRQHKQSVPPEMKWKLHPCWSIYFYEGKGLRRPFSQNEVLPALPCSDSSCRYSLLAVIGGHISLKGFQWHHVSSAALLCDWCHFHQMLWTHLQYIIKSWLTPSDFTSPCSPPPPPLLLPCSFPSFCLPPLVFFNPAH